MPTELARCAEKAKWGIGETVSRDGKRGNKVELHIEVSNGKKGYHAERCKVDGGVA